MGSTAGSAMFCLGSRTRDLIACGTLAVALVAVAPRLAVYYRGTAIEVTVVRLSPDGQRTPVPVPRRFWQRNTRTRATLARPARTLAIVEDRIRQVMRRHRPFASAAPGTRFEWTIRYSDSTPRLDRRHVYVYEVSVEPR